VRPDAGRRPGRAVRLEYDLVVAVHPAVGRLQTGRCGALTRILPGAAVVAGPRRLHCHLRRRAPAAGAVGSVLLLHARERSRTPTGSAPCSCGPPSAPGLCALIVGGAPPSAGRAPGLRGQLSGPGGAPRPRPPRRRDCHLRAVRRPPERPVRRCCFAPGGDLALPPAHVVLLRAVLCVRVVRPDRRRRATLRRISHWPGHRAPGDCGRLWCS
jgi:hypothetical protein